MSHFIQIVTCNKKYKPRWHWDEIFYLRIILSKSFPDYIYKMYLFGNALQHIDQSLFFCTHNHMGCHGYIQWPVVRPRLSPACWRPLQSRRRQCPRRPESSRHHWPGPAGWSLGSRPPWTAQRHWTSGTGGLGGSFPLPVISQWVTCIL